VTEKRPRLGVLVRLLASGISADRIEQHFEAGADPSRSGLPAELDDR
jgi:hypothetical protein